MRGELKYHRLVLSKSEPNTAVGIALHVPEDSPYEHEVIVITGFLAEKQNGDKDWRVDSTAVYDNNGSGSFNENPKHCWDWAAFLLIEAPRC